MNAEIPFFIFNNIFSNAMYDMHSVFCCVRSPHHPDPMDKCCLRNEDLLQLVGDVWSLLNS